MSPVAIKSKINEYVDRQTAARILNVSTRTLDRYLRKDILGYKKKQHRILIKKSDIDDYINKYKVDNVVDIADKVNLHFQDQSDLFEEEAEQEKQATTMLSQIENAQPGSIYKNLYYEFKQDLNQKMERLELANYKLGQLETQMQNMIPVMDHKKKMDEFKAMSQKITQEMKNIQAEKAQLEKQLRQEKLNKVVYIALLSVLVLTIPAISLLSLFGII